MSRRGVPIRMSSKGQVVIPAGVRREVGWTKGRLLRVVPGLEGEVVPAPAELAEETLARMLRDLRAPVTASGADPVEEECRVATGRL